MLAALGAGESPGQQAVSCAAQLATPGLSPAKISVGRVAFEAVYFCVHGISPTRCEAIWKELQDKDRERWELAGEAITFYESGNCPGTVSR